MVLGEFIREQQKVASQWEKNSLANNVVWSLKLIFSQAEKCRRHGRVSEFQIHFSEIKDLLQL